MISNKKNIFIVLIFAIMFIFGKECYAKSLSDYKSEFKSQFNAVYSSTNSETQTSINKLVEDIGTEIDKTSDKERIEYVIKTDLDSFTSINGNLKSGFSSKANEILQSIGYYDYAKDNASSKDFFGQATSWFGEGPSSQNGAAGAVLSQLADMINVAGTAVIVLVTIFLGIKYMYSSVEAKASIKESLINLLVACVFFFGWQSMAGILFPSNKFVFTSSSDTTYTDMIGRIFATGTYIAQILVIVVVIYVGVRYIFAGASGKADLKGKSGQFLIGIIMAFASVNFLTYISKVINEIL